MIMFGLILYNIISVPEGGTDQSVFSITYWCSYMHSLFCEWRCCPTQNKPVNLEKAENDYSLQCEKKYLIGATK